MSKEDMIEEIKKMTVVELADLVKAIEEEFGVSAVATAAPAAGAAAGAAAEEKTSFNVVLKEAGDQKIKVIKEARQERRCCVYAKANRRAVKSVSGRTGKCNGLQDKKGDSVWILCPWRFSTGFRYRRDGAC